MLHRIRMAEAEDASETSTLSSVASSEFEKLDLTSSGGSGSAMSTVFGSSNDKSSSRSSSPSRKSSSFNFLHRSSSQGSADAKKKKQDQLARWLQAGNVIYKSVGLGLMDLTVGMHLIEVAKEKGSEVMLRGSSKTIGKYWR